MSFAELVSWVERARGVLYVVGISIPILLYLWARFVPSSGKSRVFGHAASALVAAALVTMVFQVVHGFYIESTGGSVWTDLAIVAPAWFGFGTLWAATRRVSFAELRTYPLLRRVWAVLSLVALVLVAFMVLKHTYWLIFSGVLAFVIVAIIAWTLFQKVLKRVADPAPEDGDPDLFDDVADTSHDRVDRLFDGLSRRGSDKD